MLEKQEDYKQQSNSVIFGSCLPDVCKLRLFLEHVLNNLECSSVYSRDAWFHCVTRAFVRYFFERITESEFNSSISVQWSIKVNDFDLLSIMLCYEPVEFPCSIY